MKSTIIYVHRGDQFYLRPSLAQTRLYNPNARLILLGDESNSNLGSKFIYNNNIEHYNIDEYCDAAHQFSRLYIHTSSNPYDYELFCFQRWFIINEFIKKHGIHKNIVYLDSDTIIYMNLNNLFEVIKTSMTVCNKVGPQYTFFKSQFDLNKYCEFIYKSFDNKFGYAKLKKFIESYNDSGMPHISDMTTIGLYATENNLDDLGDCKRTDFYFDENITCSQCMKMGIFGKRIYKRDGYKYFKKNNGNYLRAGGCHLQGKSKALWVIYADKSITYDYFSIGTVYHLFMYYLRIIKRLLNNI